MMAANENTPSDYDTGMAAFAAAEQEIAVGISVAEAEAQRLMSEAFARTDTAERGLKKMMRRQGLEAAIDVMQQDTLKRLYLFGRTKGWLPWQKRVAAAALVLLPDALRRLEALNIRRQDLQHGRQNFINSHQQNRSPQHDRARSRGRRR